MVTDAQAVPLEHEEELVYCAGDGALEGITCSISFGVLETPFFAQDCVQVILEYLCSSRETRYDHCKHL